MHMKMLEGMGYQVETASCGEEAIRKIQLEPVDVILSDLEMPMGDGIDLARHVTHRADLAHLRLVAVTGNSERLRRKALDAGFEVVVSKPADCRQLAAVLRGLEDIDGSHMHRQE